MSVIYKKIEFLSDDRLLKGTLTTPTIKFRHIVLFIHGGGRQIRDRYHLWQTHLAEHGLPSLAFYCRGVEESQGGFSEGSLNNRLRDTEKALDFLHKNYGIEKNHVAVIASSMGGHVACRLVEKYPAIPVLVLQSAAAYAGEAEDKPLDNVFTKIIRKENSWFGSPAFDALSGYKGAVFITYGEHDHIIPDGVKNKYRSLVKKGYFYIIPQGGHTLLTPKSKDETDARDVLFQTSLEFILKHLG